MATKPLIHIGYHKTGTSWLQEKLFPNAALGLGMLDRDLVRKNVIEARPLQFNFKQAADVLLPAIEKIEAAKLYPIVSHENLSGNPHSGGFQSKENADRLSKIFESGKILIVIREQRAMIQACYQQYIKIGGQSLLPDYVMPPVRWSTRIPLFSLDNFKYHLLIEYYQQLFGQENVCVLPYELFFSEPRRFVDEILKFAGVAPDEQAIAALPLTDKANVTPTPVSLETKRRLNFMYPLNNLHRLNASNEDEQRKIEFVDNASALAGKLAPQALQDRLKQEQRDWIATTIGDMYVESNNRVATICGIELKSYGYSL